MKQPEPDDGWRPSCGQCPYCKAFQRVFRIWYSSCGGYDDEENKCKACGKVWWTEGPDA